MTPLAHVAAAVEILDAILCGAGAERCLGRWARRNRFAGSHDRAAIRDLVFDALRCRRSLAWLGGTEDGRGLMIGHLRRSGIDPGEVFTGAGYAPGPLNEQEARTARRLEDAPGAVRLDCPDWLWPQMKESLGDETGPILALMQRRAPVFLRINTARTDSAAAQRALAADGIETKSHPLCGTALEVTGNARRFGKARPSDTAWSNFRMSRPKPWSSASRHMQGDGARWTIVRAEAERRWRLRLAGPEPSRHTIRMRRAWRTFRCGPNGPEPR